MLGKAGRIGGRPTPAGKLRPIVDFTIQRFEWPLLKQAAAFEPVYNVRFWPRLCKKKIFETD